MTAQQARNAMLDRMTHAGHTGTSDGPAIIWALETLSLAPEEKSAITRFTPGYSETLLRIVARERIA